MRLTAQAAQFHAGVVQFRRKPAFRALRHYVSAGERLPPQIWSASTEKIIAILAKAGVKERIKTLGFDLIASTPEDFSSQVKNDTRAGERWSSAPTCPMNYVERADYFFFAISRRIGSPPSGPSDITNTE